MHSEVGVIGVEQFHPDETSTYKEGESDDIENVEAIVDRYDGRRNAVISILLDVQAEYRYLPRHALKYVARRLDISFSRLYSIATFYKAFSLTPVGKHTITICLGTACHVRGGARIAETLSRELGIEPGETTEDMEFTLETVNCLGACALGPVVVTDGRYHGNMTTGKTIKLLKEYN